MASDSHGTPTIAWITQYALSKGFAYPQGHRSICFFERLSWTKELKGPEAGDDAEEGSGEEGVTFDVWKKTEVPPPRDPVFDQVLCVMKDPLLVSCFNGLEGSARELADLLPSNIELSSRRCGLLTRRMRLTSTL